MPDIPELRRKNISRWRTQSDPFHKVEKMDFPETEKSPCLAGDRNCTVF